jgi:adenosine deaminase
LENGFADRIGHGLSVFKDPLLLKYVMNNGIHLEFCPTSNTILTEVGSITDHPIQIAMEKGLNFSVNTDDPGPFGCSMNGEFQLLEKTFGFSEKEFAVIFRNSIELAFAKKI